MAKHVSSMALHPIRPKKYTTIASAIATNLFLWVKQINKLKQVTFYENLGSVYEKTQRLRKLAYFISDQLDLNKEMVLFCAGGMRSALAAKSLKDMGFKKVSHIDGGFGALKQSKFKIT